MEYNTLVPMDTFNIGDKIIYPNQGLGVIEDIQIESYYGQEFNIYHVRILANDTLVLVPSSNAEEIGIRKPLTEKAIGEVLGFIRNGIIDVSMNWKGRYKEHQDLMKSGSALEVAQVLKGLFYLNLIKPLSFREKKMMEKALELIVEEISVVSSVPIEAIQEKVLESLSCCFKDVASHLDS